MSTWGWVVLVVVVVVILALIAWIMQRRRRSGHLQSQFGPEYGRTVEQTGNQRAAERELAQREKRRAELDIRPLTPAARDRYVESWRGVQSHFVDDPRAAAGEADVLVLEVMRERGYPMDDFEQRAADVSVDHPGVVEHYRAAHVIAEQNANGRATTEDLRQALQHYRALFEDLLETADPSQDGATARSTTSTEATR